MFVSECILEKVTGKSTTLLILRSTTSCRTGLNPETPTVLEKRQKTPIELLISDNRMGVGYVRNDGKPRSKRTFILLVQEQVEAQLVAVVDP